jgi:hypothetical protein
MGLQAPFQKAIVLIRLLILYLEVWRFLRQYLLLLCTCGKEDCIELHFNGILDLYENV